MEALIETISCHRRGSPPDASQYAYPTPRLSRCNAKNENRTRRVLLTWTPWYGDSEGQTPGHEDRIGVQRVQPKGKTLGNPRGKNPALAPIYWGEKRSDLRFST